MCFSSSFSESRISFSRPEEKRGTRKSRRCRETDRQIETLTSKRALNRVTPSLISFDHRHARYRSIISSTFQIFSRINAVSFLSNDLYLNSRSGASQFSIKLLTLASIRFLRYTKYQSKRYFIISVYYHLHLSNFETNIITVARLLSYSVYVLIRFEFGLRLFGRTFDLDCNRNQMSSVLSRDL